MSDILKFSKGLSNTMPATLTPGQFLIQTDTGNMYLDNSPTQRIQIKDSTKLSLTGGTLTGTLNIGTTPNQIVLSPTAGITITNENGTETQVNTVRIQIQNQISGKNITIGLDGIITNGNIIPSQLSGAWNSSLGSTSARWNNIYGNSLYINNVYGTSCGLDLSSATPIFYRENSTTGNRIQIDSNGFNFITPTSFIKIQDGNIIPNVSGSGGIGTATNKWNSVITNIVDGLATPQETENTKAANVQFVKDYVTAHAGDSQGSGLPSGGSVNTILIGSTTDGEGQWTNTLPQAVIIDDGIF